MVLRRKDFIILRVVHFSELIPQKVVVRCLYDVYFKESGLPNCQFIIDTLYLSYDLGPSRFLRRFRSSPGVRFRLWFGLLFLILRRKRGF